MRVLGINCLNHDAAMAVVDGSDILWAAHSERYSKIKNDPNLNSDIVKEAFSYGPFDKIVYYEKPFLKKYRQFSAGQYNLAFDYKELPWHYLKQFDIKIDEYISHHESHAAGGYYTSPFKECNVLVIDSIGEWETITIWHNMKKIKSWKYPYSLGLLYSAVTDRIGLKANEEEYITMGMSAYGKELIDMRSLLFKNNHRGIRNSFVGWDNMDLAYSVQKLYETELLRLVEMCTSVNIVLMGGCALNCVANSKIQNKNLWIMPNPGDSGSSLGCIAASLKHKLNWKNPFLGHNIEGDYPIEDIIKELETNKMCGVAIGKAEFGPRALGNRSLLADPRGDDIKDKVNAIKKRQMFRPFAPAILEEDAHLYFKFPPLVKKSPYMQFTAECLYPKEFPAIIHVDGSSRVQTVSEDDNLGFYNLLKRWKEKTGCPMLLNTSLNIKGQPIVNDRIDAYAFQNKYNIKVF